MRHFKVSVPHRVKKQIFDHVLYIARDSIDNALAWEDRVHAAMKAIGDAPGHAIDHAASRRTGETIHKVVFERTYLIFYRVHAAAGVIEIFHFRHGARRPKRGEP